jgi:Host cell surface-exposed lipoprotein
MKFRADPAKQRGAVPSLSREPNKEEVKVKRVFKWVLAACVVFTLISMAATACSSGDDAAIEKAVDEKVAQVEETAKSEDEAEKAEAQAEAEEALEALEAEQDAEALVEEEASAETAGQENARGSAEDYLDYSAFSRKGLIEQLEYEGYSTKDATYAVDAVSPNWNEQAAKAAKDYLDYSSFSRSGLIEQLAYEGYTEQQAVYGVNQAGL